MGQAPLAAAITLAGKAVLCLCLIGKRIRTGIACVGGSAFVLWLILGGAGVLKEVVYGLTWHVSGIPTALPLVAAPFSAAVSVLCVAAAWFVSQPSAGAYPATVLLILFALLIWLLDMPQTLWAMLPAVLGTLLMLLHAGNEDLPIRRLLPLAAAITLIGYCGVWAGGVTWEPLHDLAQDIRRYIYDTLFYTAPRDVFTLASEGYYPQGPSQLGGPAQPHTQQVMVVNTPRKTYLRGVIKDTYTGRSWVDGRGSRRYLWSAGSYRDLRSAAFDEELPMSGRGSELMQSSRVTVRMLRESASSLFVPQRIRSLTAQGDMLPYFNVSSEVFATRNLVVGDAWTVDAPLFTSQDAELETLVTLAEDPADPNWADVHAAYLQLPDHLDQRIFDIAYEAAGDADTPYRQAMNIRNYLANLCTYTLDVPEQDPTMDFVSTFLLVEKQGYCTHFASAMTVLCRMVGLPARYVEGYVAYPDGDGLAIVTGEEGHAWTEIYFKGFGWVTFDATPTSVEYSVQPPTNDDDPQNSRENPSPEPSPSPSPEPTSSPEPSEEPTRSPEPSPAPSQEPDDAPQATPAPTPDDRANAEGEPHADNGPKGPFPWWLLIVIALLLRIAWVIPGVRAKMMHTPEAAWQVWLQAAQDGLRMMGLRREKTESPQAFCRRVDRTGFVDGEMRTLGSIQSRVFYGHAKPDESDVHQTETACRQVYRSLNWWRKGAYWLLRVFVPGPLRRT